jgi:Family of unknown function (DUF6847)
MKLAEALALRADVQKRVEQMRERLRMSALVQEGDQPPEDPHALLEELERMLVDLTGLIARINRTNLATQLPDSTSLTDALARRDTLALRQSVLKAVADAASARFDRYTRSEIRRVATVDVAALRRQLDEVAKQRRELDTAIQAANWTTELVE